jgi:hypothetical protein
VRRLTPAEQVACAQRILAESAIFRAALLRIERELGRPMSDAALRGLFQRQGLAAPTSYLAGGLGDSMLAPAAERRAGELERIFVIPDVHRPYHSEAAWQIALKSARTFFAPVPRRLRRLVVMGDYADFFQVSDHMKDPRNRMGFPAEVADCNHGLDELDALGVDQKHFISGNHEWRFGRYLMNRAPQLIGLPGTTVPELFRLEERGWTWTPYMESLRVGKVYLTHDEGNAGPQAHVKARQTFEHSVVIGHTHTMASHYQGNAVGESHVGMMFGWLGDVDAVDYMHKAKARRWQHGFGVGLHEVDTGVVHMHGCPIIEDRVCVLGTIIHADTPALRAAA